MTKYLISRFLIVFLVNYFIDWAFNINAQFIQFFDTDLTDNFFLEFLSWLLAVLILGLGIIAANVIFTLRSITEHISFLELIEKIKHKGIKESATLFFENFVELFSVNFRNELHLERYPNLFLGVALVFIFFVNGNPVLNNYYGIYKEYEIEGQGRTGGGVAFVENKSYIVPKRDKRTISDSFNFLESYSRDEHYYKVKKRGYLFMQAGLIDGFKTRDRDYEGLVAYIECLFFSMMEKSINTFLYFLLPFFLAISFYQYNKKETK